MAETSEIIQSQYNLTVHEITIFAKSGEEYKIYPPASNMSYVSMEMVEGMYEASVVGKLVIKDINSTAEQINFSGFDDLVIKLENPDIPNSYKSLRYKIYNVRANEDQIKNNLIDTKNNIPNIKLEISFVSYEHYLLTYKEFTELAGSTGAGIITKIATKKESSNNSVPSTNTTTGLVNSIYEQFYKTGKTTSDSTQRPIYIEETSNWVWYKQNQSMYPWGKLNKPMKASQLMQFLAEHAVSQSNPSACNYLFWQDLDRWNFRSIESLVKEPVQKTYFVSNSPTKTGNIFSLYIINESNYLRLLESNAFSGKYYLVEPRWEDPYRNYMDYSESHKITEITYDYFRDYDNWSKVETYPLLEEDVDTKPTVANVIQDNVSGYFSPSYSNRDKTVKWEHLGYTFGNRDGNQTWQPMFDQTDLDGQICKIIQKEIKEKIKEKKIEYAQKKNLKEKWKVYRCSICCDSSYQDPDAEPVFGQEYGVAAAGGFTDIINFDKGITLPMEGSSLPLGLSLSYNFEEEPFSKTIGEIMYLREYPDIQLKYLYDLESVRVDLAKEIVDKKIQIAEQKVNELEAIPVCVNNGYCECGCNPDLPADFCQTCYSSETIFGFDNCSTGTNCSGRRCFCGEETKIKYIKPYKDIANGLQAAANSNYYDQMKELIQNEKSNFEQTYEKYKNRKAFFISKELGITASIADRNLFNVKRVTRKPIRGSKYEKLAQKSILPELEPKTPQEILAFSTGLLTFNGFSAGTTSYYPYEIFYDDNKEISPKEKHPHYDSGYKFDIGYNARTPFSLFEESGGPHAGNGLADKTNSVGISYYVVWESYSKTEGDSTEVYFNSNGCDNCVTDCGNQGGGGWGGQTNGEDCDPPNPCRSCCWTTQDYSTGVQDGYTIETTKSADLSKMNVYQITKDQILKEKLTKEAELRGLLEDGLIVSYSISNTDNSWTYELFVLPLETTGCENRENLPLRRVRSTRTYEVSKVISNNNGNSFLNQYGQGICYLNPFGAERLDNFNVIDFLNSRNFIDIEPKDNEENKRPIELVLEELESYVRVEFERPVGLETTLKFPSGFYDTPGSEYYLPYQVVITAGPHGAKSADYNISVIGQDPYGFDVAVKRIQKKKSELKADKKSLVNYKDYHVIESGYGPNGFYSSFGIDFKNTTVSYGRNFNLIPGSANITPRDDVNRTATIDSNVLTYYLHNFDIDIDQVRPNGSSVVYDNSYYNNYYVGVGSGSNQENAIQLDKTSLTPTPVFGNNAKTSVSEVFYHDYLFRTTRKNPLSLPNSYFQFSNTRLNGVYYSSTSGDITSNWNPTSSLNLFPGNVFAYWSRQVTPIPIDSSYFKSSVNYDPSSPKAAPTLAYFEYFIKNINEREEPEDEKTFFGYYYGSSIWKHPILSNDEEIQKSVWKNDYTGETEYGIIGPELDPVDSTFDRNFAAQFVVIGRQRGMTGDPCNGYPCSNPAGFVDNSSCPPDDPTCNCPCQELRPDKIGIGVTGSYSGITGSEPTYEELQRLEQEIKECDLIEEKLGEEWLGCVWGDSKNHLNCNCPCFGEKFSDYLRYSQTYCTFWNTPPERPLLRNAQMMQILAHKIAINVNGDFTVRPGMKVELKLGDKRYSGKWIVSTINHDIAKSKHLMTLTLIRDSEYLSLGKRAKELKLNTTEE